MQVVFEYTDISWLAYVSSYLFIFFARVIDVSLDVIRILFLMRDKRVLAAVIGFVEVSVFLVAISQALSGGLTDPWRIVAYAGGFATGNYIGSLIESKLALGYLLLQIIPSSNTCSLFLEELRKEGYGVTCVKGYGRDGEKTIIFVLLKRRDWHKIISIIEKIEPQAFFHVAEARVIHGGTFPGR